MADDGSYQKPLPGTQPEYLYAPYKSTRTRSPSHALVAAPQWAGELSGPRFTREEVGTGYDDLTLQGNAPALGERIVVSGRVLDLDGRPAASTLVEIWQCNSAGRYAHAVDTHDAPLDPNFKGLGRVLTDEEGGYKFTTIKPGAYPWGNHENAWRPAHIHFSVFGPSFMTRLVTQMYFPGDPLLPFDPIFNSTPDADARARMVSTFDWKLTVPERALGFHFDIVLRGRGATPRED